MTDIDRSTYLGSHAASAILGRHPFVGKHDIYMQACGVPKKKKPSTEAEIGLDLEHHVIHWYEKLTGNKVKNEQKLVVHPKHDFIRGHIDGECLEADPPHGMDGKITNPFMMHLWGKDENQIPEYIYSQAQHFMLITGYPRWDIFLMCGTYTKNYPIKADEDIQKLIEQTLCIAWEEIQELRKQKEADPEAWTERMCEIAHLDEEARASILDHSWPTAREGEQPVPSEHYGTFEQLFETLNNFNAEKGNLDQLKNDIKAAMKDTARWSGPGGKVAWIGNPRRLYLRQDKKG